MVLLRLAIGWHFFYEGAWKLAQEDWTATQYLIASSGPFRPLFRSFVKDADGRERLKLENTKKRIENRYQAFVDHYGFEDNQKQKAKPLKTDAFKQAEALFNNEDFQNQKKLYLELLGEIEQFENMDNKPEYKKERLYDMYVKKSQALNDLLARVNAPMNQMEANLMWHCSKEQKDKYGEPPIPASQTEWIDWANMIGLTAVGVGLMLGLFTRFWAVCGAGFLAMYYFAMPPWPGLPSNPMAEGHYLIVNKNLIELIALLMIATTGIGRWGGLDAFLFRRRVKCSRRETEQVATRQTAQQQAPGQQQSS